MGRTIGRSLKNNVAWAALVEGAALTADDIKAAAQQHFNTWNYVQVVMNPKK